MKQPRLPMGCLPSRSTIVPSERVETTNQKTKLPMSNNQQQQSNHQTADSSPTKMPNGVNPNSEDDNQYEDTIDNQADSSAKARKGDRLSVHSSAEVVEDDIMSILMNENQDKSKDQDRINSNDDNYVGRRNKRPMKMAGEVGDGDQLELGQEQDQSLEDGRKSIGEGSFEEEPNQDLLRQYVAIDYEITQLEDKDALRVYHEKIEQLEQLERELDLISMEAEEVAARSETGTQVEGGQNGDAKMDMESTSMLSGVTGSMSRKSWAVGNNNQRKDEGLGKNESSQKAQQQLGGSRRANSKKAEGSMTGSQMLGSSSGRHFNNLSYATVEEVFNRKIILEKERDKLKKEVEMVIVECDKLQQRYKRRDEILDKLFDGRTGNGLENHLEQQLNWLLEQKHYVDQVFYAWKRAETLTSQTCEQFTSAMELLKRLPKVEDIDQRTELVKSIGELLVKSRRDIEQAQQYNPNVDAPFFTDNETERFDTIIESLSSNSISENEIGQVLTVIQFAYKRAMSIRTWLEQILQTTIARDSFELAEEYKWIAIQLRKERINLIKAKLQNPKYQPMVQSIQEQMAHQQSMSARRQHEINRDSGIESETNDIDIEEEIYRLLEQNRSRLLRELAAPGSGNNSGGGGSILATSGKQAQAGGSNLDSKPTAAATNTSGSGREQLKVAKRQGPHNGSPYESNRDQRMRDRIQKRVKGEKPLLTTQMSASSLVLPPSGDSPKQQPTAEDDAAANGGTEDSTPSPLKEEAPSSSIGTPTRLKIELDEEAKQSLLKQVDQVHLQHKNKIERLRGSNRAKAANYLMNRMQQVREAQKETADLLG